MSKKIGLALGSGGSRGLAHIGVIKCLLENGIHIDYIAGTSAGSLVGGLFAAWNDISRVERIFQDVDYKTMIQILFDPWSAEGLIKGEKFTKFIQDNLGDTNIQDLPIRFSAVATDSVTGHPHIFNSGSLSTAIRASCSLPVIFSPLKVNEEVLVDGGVSIPVPVSVVRDMGADIIIAVNVYNGLFPNHQPNILSSMYSLLFNLAKADCLSADTVIEPNIHSINPIDFIGAKNLVDVGYKSTLEKIPEIKKLTSFWSILR